MVISNFEWIKIKNIAYYTRLHTILNIVDTQNLMLRIIVGGCNE